MARGRKRKLLEDNRLPKYVYLKKHRYVYVPYLGQGKVGKEVVLCPGDAAIRAVWRAYDALDDNVGAGTLAWLCDQYLASVDHKDKHSGTQAEYKKCHEQVVNMATANGMRFGDVAFQRITPGVIRKYRDKRATEARVRANRELAYLSVVFSWAYERDLVKSNPVKGVRRMSEKPRTRYIENAEYDLVHGLARTPHYLQPAMELAYLMRLRKSEVLDLKISDLNEEGILARRKKGSKAQLVEWSDRLRLAVERTKTPSTITSFYLLHDRKGQRITESAFDSAWGRVMTAARAQGLAERFTFHDIKAEGITDFDGDKQKSAGHRTARIADGYIRKPEKTPSTR